jgi:hypothetical protein
VTASAPSAALDGADGATAWLSSGATLRANPGYELVPLERLPTEERLLLRAAAEDEELYGLLRPADGSGLAPRSATTDLALLLLTLREPGTLPTFAARTLGDEAEETTARLVLDGVLEVEHDGGFVSGARALSPRDRPPPLSSRVGELSLAALRHAQALEGLPEELLTFRLYCFGRRPLTPALQNRLPDERGVARFLGVSRPQVRSGWVESGTKAGDAWRMFRHGRPSGGQGASFKLYVAPTLEATPDALAAMAETVAELGVCEGFKVARDAAGLCRPDKLVAYFGRLEDLHAAATRLGPRLRGLPAQPVPFTGSVDSEGLLSWGVDPAARGHGARSWRLWLTGRLASYLVEGRTDDGSTEPWRFALERIRLDGIDVESWAPASTGWDGTR